tara:strand:+ start:949 stop:1296 length:348 start_codon:yes stop_codon:yes gene_type:complete
LLGFIFAKIISFAILTAAVFATTQLVDGIEAKDKTAAIRGSVTYAVLNFLYGWVLEILLFPFALIAVGFVVSAILLWGTGFVVPDFSVKPKAALWGAVIIWGTNLGLSVVVGFLM